jgi:hypothetical protein
MPQRVFLHRFGAFDADCRFYNAIFFCITLLLKGGRALFGEE